MVGLRSLCLDSSWVFAYLFFPLDHLLHENRHHDVRVKARRPWSLCPPASQACLNCCPTPNQLRNSAPMGVPQKESICLSILVEQHRFYWKPGRSLHRLYSRKLKSPLAFLVSAVHPQWPLVSLSSLLQAAAAHRTRFPLHPATGADSSASSS